MKRTRALCWPRWPPPARGRCTHAPPLLREDGTGTSLGSQSTDSEGSPQVSPLSARLRCEKRQERMTGFNLLDPPCIWPPCARWFLIPPVSRDPPRSVYCLFGGEPALQRRQRREGLDRGRREAAYSLHVCGPGAKMWDLLFCIFVCGEGAGCKKDYLHALCRMLAAIPAQGPSCYSASALGPPWAPKMSSCLGEK